jgi:Tfp pilus assembly protein PilF
MRLWLSLVLSLTLVACASAPTTTQPAEPASGTSPPTATETPAADAPEPSVTLALRNESQRAAQSGDLAKAAALLERAIRIEPTNGELWLDLAEIRLDEGDADAAEQLARKAISFAKGRYQLEQKAYSLIDRARRER